MNNQTMKFQYFYYVHKDRRKYMDYNVKVIVKQTEMSDKEKADRITQFNQAFVTAAVDYYAGKKKQAPKQNILYIDKK